MNYRTIIDKLDTEEWMIPEKFLSEHKEFLQALVDKVEEQCNIDLVSNRISDEEIKRYRKEGRLSVSSKVKQIYKLNSDRFDENYKHTDFDILYDC